MGSGGPRPESLRAAGAAGARHSPGLQKPSSWRRQASRQGPRPWGSWQSPTPWGEPEWAGDQGWQERCVWGQLGVDTGAWRGADAQGAWLPWRPLESVLPRGQGHLVVSVCFSLTTEVVASYVVY